MKNLAKILIGIIFISGVISAQEPTEGDIQFWSETQLTIPLYKKTNSSGKKSEKVNLIFMGAFRAGGNLTKFVDERGGVGLDFKINKFLTLSPSYLYRREQPITNRNGEEHRLRFAATLEKKFSRFALKDRNLFERRFRVNAANSIRYRNKFTFTVPIVKGKKELFSFFAADEVFYDFLAKAWTRNEFSPGISKKFNKNLTAEFFYLLQTNRSLPLKQINAFGVNLKIKVD